MKAHHLDRYLLRIGLSAGVLLITGCGNGRFYLGELDEETLRGTWSLSASPAHLAERPPSGEKCQIKLLEGGRFEAVNFPLILDYSPPPKIKYVTETGSWELVDVSERGGAVRWELQLHFNQSRHGVTWEVIGSRESLRLFGTTDLDYWIGFEFSPAAASHENPAADGKSQSR